MARKPKKEWHIFSALAVTCAITFIGAQYFTGTLQVIGAAFGPIVGTYFFTSTNWKNKPGAVHLWIVLIALFAIIGPAILVKLKLLPKKWLRSDE